MRTKGFAEDHPRLLPCESLAICGRKGLIFVSWGSAQSCPHNKEIDFMLGE